MRKADLYPPPWSHSTIAFTHNLIESHSLPTALAYQTALSQFTTLRAEHSTATLAARLEAEAHGAEFFGEIQRGIQVEERVLDEWVGAREIQDRIAATKGKGGGKAIAGGAAAAAVGAGDKGMWAAKEQELSGVVGGVVEFTGGVKYVERFAQAGKPAPEQEETLEAR